MAFNRMLRQLVQQPGRAAAGQRQPDGKVDELAQANMRLYEMNRLKSDFLATMSHELRTPLNSIIGFSDVLGSIDSLDDKQKRYVQNIQKSGKMLLEMINDILDLAKIESGKMEIRPVRFPHRAGGRGPVRHGPAADRAQEHRPGVRRSSRDLPPMYQDQAKVQQILNNLLSNAIKFTPEGGRIVVGARSSDAANLLVLTWPTRAWASPRRTRWRSSRSSAKGNVRAHGGDAMTREYSGTGLGLSIVKELCKLLGGEVSLESELGKGSTFTVRLPWTCNELPRRDADLPAGQRRAPTNSAAATRRTRSKRQRRKRRALAPLPHCRRLPLPSAGMMAKAQESGGLPEVQLFTDGACSGNPGPGRLGLHPAASRDRQGMLERSGGEPETTNNRMELTAVVRGLEALKRPSHVELMTDSVYVGKGLSEWMPKWKANGWRRREGRPVERGQERRPVAAARRADRRARAHLHPRRRPQRPPRKRPLRRAGRGRVSEVSEKIGGRR